MEWIKVSERLPDAYVDVIVTYRDYGNKRYVDIACYESDEDNAGFYKWDDYSQDNIYLHGVIAWMPFPEAYKD